VDPEWARDVLAQAEGVRLVADATVGLYPQARTVAGPTWWPWAASGKNVFNDNGLVLWLAVIPAQGTA